MVRLSHFRPPWFGSFNAFERLLPVPFHLVALASKTSDLALKTCGGSNGGTGGGVEEEVGELCDTHAAYAAWLDA